MRVKNCKDTGKPGAANCADSCAWFVYMVRCADGSLYTGTASDVPRRFSEHEAQGKRCAKYLRGKAPLKLVFAVSAGDRAAACRLEAAIKKLPRDRKAGLTRGEIAAITAMSRKFYK